MNIVKLVILFCDHCVLLCNMCKRFGILPLLPPFPLFFLVSSFSFSTSSSTAVLTLVVDLLGRKVLTGSLSSEVVTSLNLQALSTWLHKRRRGQRAIIIHVY